AGGRRDLSSKIRARTIDAFSERIVHETRDLDGTADLAFGILQRLGDALVGIMNIGLLQQADLLVESLEPGLDDLDDRRLRLALSAELVGENIFLARHPLRLGPVGVC